MVDIFIATSKMKLTIEQFSSILCIGFTTSSSVERNLCCEIREYKDLQYDEIFDSVQMLGLKYSKEFTEAIGKIGMSDIKDGFTSKSKFMCFILSRCMKLSETPTLFSFLLVSIFVHKIVSDIFRLLEIECFTVAKIASKCLIAAFYRWYTDLFDKENGFEGFAEYCEKLNETLFPSDEDSETENEKICIDLKSFSPPNADEIAIVLQHLKEIDKVDFMLSDFEKKLLYERDSLLLNIDPVEDIFVQLDDGSGSNRIANLDIAVINQNIKSEHTLECLTELCQLCKSNCYKHVVFAAKELKIDDI